MAKSVKRADFVLLRLAGGRYGALLCWLLAVSVLAPGLTGGRFMGLLLDLLMCAVLLAGLRAARPDRWALAVASILIVADLISHLASVYIPDRAEFALHYGVTLLVLGFATRTILSMIVRDSQVTLETLKAAVCVYLLIGLIWVYIFALIDLAIPGSFLIRRDAEGDRFDPLLVSAAFPKLLYFSYATLTTLGYGDILPLSGPARTFSYLEAIVGQVYLTVLIARLVGMHITQSSGEGRQRLEVETRSAAEGAEGGRRTTIESREIDSQMSR
jgi:hypothetical protein